MGKKKAEFEYRILYPGDIVEFPENHTEARFGVVDGGFGMHPDSIGTKIFGSFGKTVEDVKQRHELFLLRNKDLNLDFRGFTRTQQCKVVGHLTLSLEDFRDALFAELGDSHEGRELTVELMAEFYEEYKKADLPLGTWIFQKLEGCKKGTGAWCDSCTIVDDLNLCTMWYNVMSGH
uniref:Uncharacterized protein n=1 Tax=viral metagenome TaxID=1070528 RepID=A0A6M3J4Q2_9ZZZZ